MTDLQAEEQRLAEARQAVHDAYHAVYELFPEEEMHGGKFDFDTIAVLHCQHPKLLKNVQASAATLRNTEDDLFLNGSPEWENGLRDTMMTRVAELAGTTYSVFDMHNVIYAATKGTDMYAEHGVSVPAKPVVLSLADHFQSAGKPDAFMPFGYGAFNAFDTILKGQNEKFSDKALNVKTEYGPFKLEICDERRNLLAIMDKLFGKSQLEQNFEVQERGVHTVVCPTPAARYA